MRILKQSTISGIVAQTGLSYESVLKFLYEQHSDPGAPDLIRKAAADMGCSDDLLESIRPPAHRTIGIVLPEYIVDDYMGRILSGMTTALEKSGYQATLHSVDMNANVHEAGNYYHALFATGAAEDSFIITYTSGSTKAIIPFCERYQHPYILMDHDFSEDTRTSPSICIDNRQATMDAVRALVNLSHRRIGFITGLLPAPSAYYRLRGYQDALIKANLPFDPDLVVEGNWQVDISAAVTRQLLALKHRPTAIIASNDVMAISAMSEIAGAGLKIPRELSLIGFDDIEMASYTRPSLSTIRQPMVSMGQRAVEVAIMLAEGKPLDDPKILFSTELILRDSTGPAPR